MDFNLLTTPARWCFPAFIYVLFIGYLMIVTMTLEGKLPDGREITMKHKLLATLAELLWGVVVLYIMLMCCKSGYETIAWAILLVPLALRLLKVKL